MTTKRKRPTILSYGWLAIRAIELGHTNYRILDIGESFEFDDEILDSFSGEWNGTNLPVGIIIPLLCLSTRLLQNEQIQR